MFDTQDIPDFFHSITFDNKTTVEFNQESMLIFYNGDDEEVMRLAPTDLTMLYSAYRGMVREMLEDESWNTRSD